MLQGVKLSKTQSLTTVEDRERMKVIPYASAIGSIKYAMLCTRPIVYPALSLAREYNSDLGVDHWTAVAIRPQTAKSLCISVIPGSVMLTHTVLEGFITECNHTNYIECVKRELITIIWLKAI